MLRCGYEEKNFCRKGQIRRGSETTPEHETDTDERS